MQNQMKTETLDYKNCIKKPPLKIKYSLHYKRVTLNPQINTAR